MPSERQVNAKWTPSERQVNAKWTPSERQVNAKWTPNKRPVNTEWTLSEPEYTPIVHAPSGYAPKTTPLNGLA